MRNLILFFALILSLPLVGQIPVNTPFEANTNNALDNRLVQDNLSDTASISFKYDGMLVFFKDVSQLWTWKGSWSEFSGGPSTAGELDVVDTQGFYTSGNLEGVTQEIGDSLASISSRATTNAGNISTNSGSISTLQGDVTTIQNNQTVGLVGYPDKATMDTATTQPANTVARISDDSTPANNGYYRYTGASWVKQANLHNGEVESNNLEAVEGGKIFTHVGNEILEKAGAMNNRLNNTAFIGTTGWSGLNITFSTSDSIMTAVHTAANADVRQQFIPVVTGHQYYVAWDLKVNSARTTRASISNFSSTSFSTTADVFNRYSTVLTSLITGNSDFRFNSIGGVSGDTFQLKKIVVINMTEVFGAGNELSAEDMDIILSFYPSSYFTDTTFVLDYARIAALLAAHSEDLYNVTAKKPLLSGYYTLATAVAAVPIPMRKLGMKITFQKSASNADWEEAQFVSANVANWSNLSFWVSREIQFLVDGSIRDYGYGMKDGTGTIDFTTLMSGFNIQADHYWELVVKINPSTPDLTSIFESGISNQYIRARFGNTIDAGFYNTSSTRTILQAEVGNNVTHIIFVKTDTTFTLYVNGAEVSSGVVSGSMKLPLNYLLRTTVPLYLFRIGATSVIDPVARYNKGLPLEVEVDDAYMEFKAEGFTTDYLYDNVSRSPIRHTTPLTVITENPYPAEIIGSGAPFFVPQFVRQRYHDSTSVVDYIARGNALITDWKAIPTSQELDAKQNTLVSGSNIKTINSVSILGSGNITVGDGGVSVESREYENVTAYGAVGNGIQDDTQAIEEAIDAAALNGNYVYFPTGTYLIRRGLVLKTGVRLLGALNAEIRKAPAITQLIQANVAVGDTFAIVQNASVYEVGQEISILTDEAVSGAGGNTVPSFGVISSIDSVTNRVNFTPRAGYAGAVANVVVGPRSYFTNDFSMITTNNTIRSENNIVDGLILNKNAQSSDPIYYFFATIHTNPNSSNTIVRNCKILGSNSDGISFQGSADMIYEDNYITDVVHNSIHFGTTCERIFINNNYIKNSNQGVFWCFNNKKVNVTNNHFVNCNTGCGSIDDQEGLGDRESNIAFNTFDNCGLYGVQVNGGKKINIVNNFFLNFNNGTIPVYSRFGTRMVVSGNQFDNFSAQFSGSAVRFSDVSRSIISNNLINNYRGAGAAIDIDQENTGCNQIVLSGNNIDGIGSTGVRLDNSTNCIVTSNIIKVGTGLTAISQLGTNTGLVLSNNISLE